ncbi:DUF2848 family protein [Pantoea sp. LMR881]|uniref:DUF2848 family protein n=1 Tax=Pantoea sp. LMR881 TaxID=3014336 RepID=UPI0022AF9371|nr:DUF2848 family protein [Pantoea sp. LMR881]MCZ4060941.1 DUF2848 family protein [Pantoea sp. LMR881]
MCLPRCSAAFYRVATNQLTQKQRLEVVGSETSGEAEPFVFCHRGELWVSLTSDHTDRHLETFSVALSKQACIAGCPQRVAHERSSDHWDALALTSWIKEQDEWVVYQSKARCRHF